MQVAPGNGGRADHKLERTRKWSEKKQDGVSDVTNEQSKRDDVVNRLMIMVGHLHAMPCHTMPCHAIMGISYMCLLQVLYCVLCTCTCAGSVVETPIASFLVYVCKDDFPRKSREVVTLQILCLHTKKKKKKKKKKNFYNLI